MNLQLAKAAKKIVEDAGSEFAILDYSDVPFMNQDIEVPAPEAVRRVRKSVTSADGIWIFTPEYNHSYPGVLKNLIDWLSRPVEGTTPQVLGGKPVAISGVTKGVSGTGLAQEHLLPLLSCLNMDIMQVPRLLIPRAGSQMHGDTLALTDSLPFLEQQAAAFLKFMER